jgi:hypothetical protein
VTSYIGEYIQVFFRIHNKCFINDISPLTVLATIDLNRAGKGQFCYYI